MGSVLQELSSRSFKINSSSSGRVLRVPYLGAALTAIVPLPAMSWCLPSPRLLVLEAADQLDRLGNKKACGIIAMANVAAPSMALQVLDMAMQVHGALGLSSDSVLSHLWVTSRTLRIADGPDEVHLGTIAKLELQRSKL